MKKRRMIAGLASCAMATTLVACSSGSSDKNNTLTVGVNQELNGVFSPAYYSSSYDNYAIDLVYEGLLGYNAENELVPELAQEMPEISEDGLTFTFKIREGAKFSDGTPVTSKDVKYSFTLLADPSYTGRFAINAENIVGYEEYNKGDATELTGIETPDDETVIIHAKEPRIDNLVTFGDSVRIMSAAQFDYKKGDTSEIESNTSDMLGSGPYKLNSYDKASGASFVRNENYEAKDGEYTVEKIIIKTTDVQTEVDELKSGNVDLLPQTIEQQKIGTVSKDDKLTYNTYFRAGEGYIGFNAGEGHTTADNAVRQALSYATDRQAFVDSYFKFEDASDEVTENTELGYVPDVYWNPVSENLGEYVRGEKTIDGLTVYNFDLEKAKSVLEEAGWKVGDDGYRYKDGTKLEVKWMLSKDNSVLDTLIPMVQKSWKEIGVDLKQTTVDFNTLLDTVSNPEKSSEWDIFFLATGYTGLADSDANNYYGDTPDNYSHIQDAQLEDYLKKGLYINDVEVSKENYLAAMQRASQLDAYLPIYGNQYFDLYNKRVKNLNTSSVHSWAQAMDQVTLEN